MITEVLGLGIQMQNQNNNRKNDKRRGTDRRAQAIGLDFPFIDGHGNLVTEERRKIDRRKSEILNNSHHDRHQNSMPDQLPYS